MRRIINLLRGNGNTTTSINREGDVTQIAEIDGDGEVTQVADSDRNVTQVANVSGSGRVTQVGGNAKSSRRRR
jgi:hypothetical protein